MILETTIPVMDVDCPAEFRVVDGIAYLERVVIRGVTENRATFLFQHGKPWLDRLEEIMTRQYDEDVASEALEGTLQPRCGFPAPHVAEDVLEGLLSRRMFAEALDVYHRMRA